MMALIDHQVAVRGDAVIYNALSDEALDQGNIELPSELFPSTTQPSDVRAIDV